MSSQASGLCADRDPREQEDADNGREGEEVLSFGGEPWMIVNGDMALALTNTEITKAHVLDATGIPVREIPLAAATGR